MRTLIVAIIVALVAAGGGFYLGRFGPVAPWWLPTLDGLDAAISTANATWFSVATTFLAFVATVGVFASAFTLQRKQAKDASDLQGKQFTEDRRKEADARRVNGKDAIATIRRSQEVIVTVQRRYCQPDMPSDKPSIWRDLSDIQTHQIITQHFLNSALTELDVLFLLGSNSHRLQETRDALKRLVPDDEKKTVTDDDRAWCREVLKRASDLIVEGQVQFNEVAGRYV